MNDHKLLPVIRKALFFAAFIVSSIWAVAQNAQAEYLEARRLFKEGKYGSAKGYFGALTEDIHFGKYASFYYALSAFNQGDTTQAIEMWKQLLVKAPGWSEENEVLFWLAYSNLATDHLNAGIRYADRLERQSESSDQKQLLYSKFLLPQEIGVLKSLSQTYREDSILAITLFTKLMTAPYDERDFTLLRSLDDKWGLQQSELLVESLPEILKDKYRVGVLLPFMYDTANIEYILQNKAVMALYQGMVSGAEQLARKKINLELVPMDTKRSKSYTESMLSALPADYLDLMVGPLLAAPFEAATAYSKANKINMINPVSSSSSVVGDNPFSFLFKPTYETMAMALARQAVGHFSNKNLMIFYENNDRDSLFAAVYKREMEYAGFEVVWMKELNAENAKNVLDTLIAEYEVYYTDSEADSVAAIPGRFVKDRRLRDDELQRLAKFRDGKTPWDSVYYQNLPVSYNEDEKAITYYETKLCIEPDSIGHILGATSKNFMANNLISAVETMGDSTVLFGFGGYKDWLDFTMLSLNQLERNGVSFVYPEYVAYWGDEYAAAKQMFVEKWKSEPSVYHLIGYELIMQLGPLLKQHGKYFQNGLIQGGYRDGYIFQGIKYGTANDNQIAPIVRFEDAKLKVVNRDTYEDR